jgi:hypothetical protein
MYVEIRTWNEMLRIGKLNKYGNIILNAIVTYQERMEDLLPEDRIIFTTEMISGNRLYLVWHKNNETFYIDHRMIADSRFVEYINKHDIDMEDTQCM